MKKIIYSGTILLGLIATTCGVYAWHMDIIHQYKAKKNELSK